MKNNIATIGFFDGVHKGHRFLFEHLRSLAQSYGLTPLIITFDKHPRAVLQADYIPSLLTSLEERKALLEEVSGAKVVVFPFDQICSFTAARFMQLLRDEYDVQALLMGYDHMFGSDRLRHVQDYSRIARELDMDIYSLHEYSEGEWHISSTEIRLALENGNIALANDLLGRPYDLTGTVVRGNGIGRTIGYPTANIQPGDMFKIIPHSGVYVVLVECKDLDLSANALCNIGTNPTVGNTEQTIELYIPSFSGDLYGRTMRVAFLRFIREEERFDSLDALKKQIEADLRVMDSPSV